MKSALTIAQLNSYVKQVLDKDEILQNIHVVGEISNFKSHTSGHLYFSLKDEKCSVKSIMFSSYALKLRFEPRDGLKVFVYGYISCYINTGQYQLYACDMLPAGIGEINKALEKLRAKLSKEGLFDDSKKIPIPKFPRKIGVVTSKTGAVIHDIANVLSRRYPIGIIALAPVKVQGAEAPNEILIAISKLDKEPEVDVIIIGRGGGSLEELWAFNDERVVRAVASCETPIISAVGHEVDYTLCDFAADSRAPTPSAAAEIASVNLDEISNLIKSIKQKDYFLINNIISKNRSLISDIKLNLKKLSPITNVSELRSKLNQLKIKNKNNIFKILESKKAQILSLKKSIATLNPDNTLLRGYSIARYENKIIKGIEEIKNNTELSLTFSNGTAKFRVTKLSIIRRDHE
ncbi:MAG: exodeoxyribonuclease VII large subunit [Oscillospiraceae bacterium]|nr:exodeoxyribonuclease VII large subunit [Oscillospiraceae bacterium]